MKRLLEIVAIASRVFFYLPTPCRAGNEGSDSKIEELLRKMTLEEKVYQLCADYFGTGAEVFQESGLITEARISEQFGTHGVGFVRNWGPCSFSFKIHLDIRRLYQNKPKLRTYK